MDKLLHKIFIVSKNNIDMEYNKIEDVILKLYQYNKTFFTLNDAAKLMNKSNKYTSKLLSKNKYVSRIENGKYLIKMGNGIDLYEIASNIVYPSYISLFSAFEYHSITEQIVSKFSVISPVRHRNIIMDNYEIEFRSIKKNKFFGYTRINNTYVATVEKAIIDSIYYSSPEFSYVEETFINAMKSRKINIKKLRKYAKTMDSKIIENKINELINSYKNIKGAE